MAKKTDPVESVSKVKNAHGMPAKIQAVADNMTAWLAELGDDHAAATDAAGKDAVVAEFISNAKTAIAEAAAGLGKDKG